jgi:hypothetical protein
MKVIPPTMAAWMLKHLVLGHRNEALEGDLLEEFQRRRSASWYWRQVLGAMFLGFSHVLRAGWVTVWTVVFAGVWLCGLYARVCFTAGSPPQAPFGLCTMHEPYGQAIQIAWQIVLYLVGPLFVYLALARSLSLRAFTLGLGAGVLVIVAFPFVRSLLATPFNYFLAHGRAKHWNVILWVHWWDVSQVSLPLLAAMWAAALSKIKMVGTLDLEEATPHAPE